MGRGRGNFLQKVSPPSPHVPSIPLHLIFIPVSLVGVHGGVRQPEKPGVVGCIIGESRYADACGHGKAVRQGERQPAPEFVDAFFEGTH